jgi:toxin FitB
MFLIDTNVISEWRKGARCDANVASWFTSIDDNDLYLSVLVLGEIRRGIELLRRRDPVQARALESWLARVDVAFGDRILPIDREVADEWGRLKRNAPDLRCGRLAGGNCQDSSNDAGNAQRV